VAVVGSAIQRRGWRNFGPLRLAGHWSTGSAEIAIMLLSKRPKNFAQHRLSAPASNLCPDRPLMCAVVMFFTTGPKQHQLLSSGLTYGFRRTVQHIMGHHEVGSPSW